MPLKKIQRIFQLGRTAGGRATHKPSHIHWMALAQTLGPILLVSSIAIWVTLFYVQPAPPRTLTLAAGTPGSAYAQAAAAYQKALKKNGITLNIVSSQGAIENLQRISDPHSGVDIALVQSGLKPGDDDDGLVSLGSMFYQPLYIFYHAPKPMIRLSELIGKRIAVGAEGSGTRHIAQTLLTANGLGTNATELLPLEGEKARQALLSHEVDAIVLTGDSTAPATIRQMLHEDSIRLFDFTRADAYLRRFPYLHKIIIPAGAIDIGEDLPSSDLTLLAATVDMIARPSLHPALTDVLIEAATEVHNRTTLLQTAGDFPRPLANGFPLSEAALRYYKSGDRSFLYRIMPFWLASLANRLIVMLLPLVVVVIPGLRFAPQLYRWRISHRIHHRYGELMALEREAHTGQLTEERRLSLMDRLNGIEHSLIGYRIPGSHADQLYLLRQHINFVRHHLAPPGEAVPLPAELLPPIRHAAAQ